MKATYAFLITGLAAQQAVATWNFFDKFNTPNYNTNECSEKEKTGFNWSDLQIGQSDFQYGDFDFSKGWSCANSLAKRDGLTKRTFGNRVIKNRCSKQKPASFGCGSKKQKGFSIKDMDISVEFDVDLEFRFTMTDGSKCKQYSKCSAGGTTVKNTQCGGAVSVDIFIGTHFQGSRSDCEIGFHNIGFDCNAGTTYTKPSPPQIPATSTVQTLVISSAVVSTVISSPPATTTEGVCDGTACDSSSTVETSTPAAATTPVVETTPIVETTAAVSTPVVTPPGNPPYSMIPPFANSSIAIVTPPSTTESSVVVLTSTALSTETSTSMFQESSAIIVSSVVSSSTVDTLTSSAVVVVSSIATPSPSSPSYPPASPPDVLPRCMNSWLQISTKCKDNTDKSCYCVNAEFTKNVIDCVSSWCGTDEETRQSLTFFIGICAEHVPENPKIIEDCPPYIPLNPTPAAPSGGASSQAVAIGSTTVAGVTTPPAGQTTVPGQTTAPVTTAPTSTPCTTITYGSTSITVPQVHFTTEPAGGNQGNANPTAPVELIPGTAPAQVPAATTPGGAIGGGAAPYPTTMGTATVPLASGTGAVRPSSPAQFTGAAAPFAIVPQHALIGAVLAFFAL